MKLILALLLFFVFSACEKKRDPSSASEHIASSDRAATEEEHPYSCSKAKPGSHADWCGEHQVPESLCTRCNASLIPAFKATGDWCEEHGLPETQCLICNPRLKIERPPRTGEANP